NYPFTFAPDYDNLRKSYHDKLIAWMEMRRARNPTTFDKGCFLALFIFWERRHATHPAQSAKGDNY
ncbi:hypothetical protein QL626_22480, partial [Bacillus subtilis]|nr:hypothetical protein [Bacillus subtilis]